VFASVGDDEHWIYADGKLVGEGHWWNTVVYSNIHVSTRVIAIEVSNNGGGFGGVVGSLSDGLTVTDDTWKCTTTLHDNWNQVDFNDSSWSQAVPMPQLKGATDGRAAHKELATNAKWIWTEEQQPPFNYSTPNTTIYCRKRR
jgi:hypothetical protein